MLTIKSMLIIFHVRNKTMPIVCTTLFLFCNKNQFMSLLDVIRF